MYVITFFLQKGKIRDALKSSPFFGKGWSKNEMCWEKAEKEGALVR
jgi:hypothetical protein